MLVQADTVVGIFLPTEALTEVKLIGRHSDEVCESGRNYLRPPLVAHEETQSHVQSIE